MKKIIIYSLLAIISAGCAFTPETRLSGTDGEWWDNHKNRSIF